MTIPIKKAIPKKFGMALNFTTFKPIVLTDSELE